MLNDTQARKLKPSGKPAIDGYIPGLRLYPKSRVGTGNWILRYTSPENGRRRDMGLGSYPMISIREARDRAFEARRLIEGGKDPLEERARLQEAEKRKVVIPTFKEAAQEVFSNLKLGFRNEKHADQWIRSLELYIFPKIGRMEVTALKPKDFARALKPIWLTKPESASRVKQRCDAVMKWCAANDFITASPVSVVTLLLPKQPSKRERTIHQPAVPWREIPAFVEEVLHDGPRSQTKLMMEVLILTASRSGEIRAMAWPELDFDAGVWTVPASRMKAKVAHRVPLSPYLCSVLKEWREKEFRKATPLVFPSRNYSAVTDMRLTKFLRDNQVPSDTPGRIATAHGFRSSFRDWASENGYARDLAERALAHTIRNATEAAYHRTDLLEQRREMMLAWERWVLGS